MLLLTSTGDKIQIITGSAGNIDVHVSYIDLASGVVTAGRKNSKITTATTTDVVDPPGASTTRNTKTLHVANIHATNSNLVTIQHTDGTNAIQIEQITLLAGERIAYREGVGTRVIDANGVEKTNPNALVTSKKLASDTSNSTTTAAKVTGLDLLCPIGTYMFEYYLIYQTVATTTGLKLGVNHTGTVSSFCYQRMEAVADTTASASQTAIADQDILTTTGGLVEVWAARTKSTTAPMITAGVDTANADQLCYIQGLAIVTASGNLELYAASEFAASNTTIKAGSALRLTQII